MDNTTAGDDICSVVNSIVTLVEKSVCSNGHGMATNSEEIKTSAVEITNGVADCGEMRAPSSATFCVQRRPIKHSEITSNANTENGIYAGNEDQKTLEVQNSASEISTSQGTSDLAKSSGTGAIPPVILSNVFSDSCEIDMKTDESRAKDGSEKCEGEDSNDSSSSGKKAIPVKLFPGVNLNILRNILSPSPQSPSANCGSPSQPLEPSSYKEKLRSNSATSDNDCNDSNSISDGSIGSAIIQDLITARQPEAESLDMLGLDSVGNDFEEKPRVSEDVIPTDEETQDFSAVVLEEALTLDANSCLKDGNKTGSDLLSHDVESVEALNPEVTEVIEENYENKAAIIAPLDTENNNGTLLESSVQDQDAASDNATSENVPFGEDLLAPPHSPKFDSQPTRSALKRRAELSDSHDSPKRKRRNITFDGVTVFYFPRTQGFTCVPSQVSAAISLNFEYKIQQIQ